jgi:RNA polymerase sigma factor (sigma-70 family)
MSELPLTAGSCTLAADLFERYSAVVRTRLGRRFPEIDPQMLCDAVVEAIVEVSRDFSRYDPERGSVERFVEGAARRKLKDLRRSAERRRRREKKKMSGPVTGGPAAARPVVEALADRDLAERARQAVALSEEERRVLDLWLNGEQDRSVYAAALGLSGAARDQERQVDRVLARLRQRLHRFGQRLREEGIGP